MPTDSFKNCGCINYKPRKIGKSVLGIPLEIYRTQHENDLLLIAGMHGEEAESIVLLSKCLRSLKAPLAANLILCLNPDGIIRGTRGNANGVDLNRNFPASNWSSNSIYHRWELDSPQNVALSPGGEPASEPETKALLKTIKQLNPKVIVSFHGPLSCVDDPLDSNLGRWLAKKSELPLVTDIGYPTPGSLGSWCSESQIDLITLKLPPSSAWHMQKSYLPIFSDLLEKGTNVSNAI